MSLKNDLNRLIHHLLELFLEACIRHSFAICDTSLLPFSKFEQLFDEISQLSVHLIQLFIDAIAFFLLSQANAEFGIQRFLQLLALRILQLLVLLDGRAGEIFNLYIVVQVTKWALKHQDAFLLLLSNQLQAHLYLHNLASYVNPNALTVKIHRVNSIF